MSFNDSSAATLHALGLSFIDTMFSLPMLISLDHGHLCDDCT